MSVQTVTRAVQVNVCDECSAENEHLDRCGICRKDKCTAHMAYSFDDLYRHSPQARVWGQGRHVCKECAGTKVGTIGALLDLMLA